MRLIKLLAITGTCIMFLTLIYGFVRGDILKEGSILVSLAWGRVSLIDVYVGFFLFSGWILYREEKWLVAVLWILLIMVLGNFITCLYAAFALFKSNGNYHEFWLGKHFKTNH